MILDKKLPSARPRFIRHEVLVGSEVCEVYLRDVVECVRALMNDSALSPHMVFAPEKHYTDETKQVRMYHDMHTGDWWWSTQVHLP